MMIGYVYFKESKMIICKIDNVSSIDINGKEINGDSTIRFGDSQDFIILETDTINKNIGDIIIIDELIDARDYFIKGKDYWYQEKIDKLNNRLEMLETIPNLPSRVTTSEDDININEDTINSILTDILPKLMS